MLFRLMLNRLLLVLCVSASVLFGYYAAMDENVLFGLGVAIMSLVLFDLLDIVHIIPTKGRKRSLWVFLAVLVFFRTFLYDVMFVPSGSMTPTLLTGDYVLVKKAEYGFNKESLWPVGKWFSWMPTIQWREPKRGDIAVWTRAKDPIGQYYVKRAVGVGGDLIQMKDGILHVNNKPMQLLSLPSREVLCDDGVVNLTQVYEEKDTMSGKEHLIVRDTYFGHASKDNTDPLYIPEGHFAIVGDNRMNGGSHDSRYSDFPPMPYNQIIGKAKVVLFSTTSWKYFPRDVTWLRWAVEVPVRFLATFWYIRKDRIFKSVQ